MAAFADDVVIDYISGEQITPAHAVIVSTGDENILECVKSVGRCIGSRNIRSAYQTDGRIKIYLRFLKHVDEVVNSGIFVHGQHKSIEYSIPPGTLLLLHNVDTEIPNDVLKDQLAAYGKVVNPIITKTIEVNDTDYCHIESNTRQVYVKLFSSASSLNSFNLVFDYAGQRREVLVSPKEKGEYGKMVQCETDITSVRKTSRRVVIKNATQSEEQNKIVQAVSRVRHVVSSKKKQKKMNASVSKVGRRGRGRGVRGNWQKGVIKRKMSTVRSENLKSVVFNCEANKKKYGTLSKYYSSHNMATYHAEENTIESENTTSDVCFVKTVQSEVTEQPSDIMNADDTNNQNDNEIAMDTISEMDISSELSADKSEKLIKFPFSLKVLERFLKDVKNNRNPLELATNMLEENSTPGAYSALCSQLEEYQSFILDKSMRNRINRLIFLISGSQDHM